MPESGTYGSVRGAAGNSRPYRECRPVATVRAGTGAGVRNPPGKEPASREARQCREHYGDFAVVCWLVDATERR
jgi:hypothetical protein